MSPANQIRDYVDRHYLNGSPAGRELLDIADRVDALTDAASPVSGKNDDPVPKESHAK